MSIRFTKYINITSGVIGQGGVPDRSFCGRFFTNNSLVPPQSMIECTTAADVGTYFGTASEEYKRAVQYFGFVSKQTRSPTVIQFARWCDVAVAPLIYGGTAAKTLASLQAVTAGGFTLSLGGVPLVATALNLSTAVDLAGVAALMQTKIRTGTGTIFTAATVTYDPTTNRFNFVAGATGAAAISLTDGAQTPLALLGWAPSTTTGLIVAAGSAAEAPEAAFNNSVVANDNFGSFLFMPVLTQTQFVNVANANDALNNQFLMAQDVSVANAAAWAAAAAAISGVAMTLSPIITEFPEQDPMMILAATDYTSRNAAQNYMYQVFSNQTPSVTDDTNSDLYDSLAINYYGQTMKNGRTINFYQRGVLFGSINDARDIGVYCNEMWFKAAMGTRLMDLLLAVTQVPATSQGRAMLLSVSRDIISQALLNGTIAPGKILTANQKVAIVQATGDDKAWYQVQSSGFWIDWAIAPFTNTSGIVEYKATYTLCYSKDDVIRTIQGVHDLV